MCVRKIENHEMIQYFSDGLSFGGRKGATRNNSKLFAMVRTKFFQPFNHIY
jgi:hypothetical protein